MKMSMKLYLDDLGYISLLPSIRNRVSSNMTVLTCESKLYLYNI